MMCLKSLFQVSIISALSRPKHGKLLRKLPREFLSAFNIYEEKFVRKFTPFAILWDE
jgi:hypothetical protein